MFYSNCCRSRSDTEGMEIRHLNRPLPLAVPAPLRPTAPVKMPDAPFEPARASGRPTSAPVEVPTTPGVPVVRKDLPDPGVFRDDDGTYYLSVTSGGYDLYTSKDLVHWEPAGEIFPEGSRPDWMLNKHWAPELHKVGDKYYATYTAVTNGEGNPPGVGQSLSVGLAVADSPRGPWTDIGEPLVKPFNTTRPDGTTETIGVLDSSLFVDEDGKQYFVWKEDQRAHYPSRILRQEIRLTDTGAEKLGEPEVLLVADASHELKVIEGPQLVRKDGQLQLWYSFGQYWNETYGLGYAVQDPATGEFVKQPGKLMESVPGLEGPGHGTLVQGPDGRDYYVHHGMNEALGKGRMLYVSPVSWDEHGRPIIDYVPKTLPEAGPPQRLGWDAD